MLELTGHLPATGFLAVVPIMGLTFGSYLATALIEKIAVRGEIIWPVSFLRSPYTWAFFILFLLAQDWWRWGETPTLIQGWPAWIFYFLFLFPGPNLAHGPLDQKLD